MQMVVNQLPKRLLCASQSLRVMFCIFTQKAIQKSKKKSCAQGLQPTKTNPSNTASCKKSKVNLMKNNQWGEIIGVELASIVNGRFSHKLGEETLKKQFKMYDRPQNCQALVVPTVNWEIFTQPPASARKNDLNLLHTLCVIVKAAVAVLHTTSFLFDGISRKQTGQEVWHCTYAIALLRHANRELALHSCAVICPHVNKRIARIHVIQCLSQTCCLVRIWQHHWKTLNS